MASNRVLIQTSINRQKVPFGLCDVHAPPRSGPSSIQMTWDGACSQVSSIYLSIYMHIYLLFVDHLWHLKVFPDVRYGLQTSMAEGLGTTPSG